MINPRHPAAFSLTTILVLLAACGTSNQPPASGSSSAVAPMPSPSSTQTSVTQVPSDGVVVYAAGDAFNGQAQLSTIWPDGTHHESVRDDKVFDLSVSPTRQVVLVEGADKAAIIALDGGGYRTLALSAPGLRREFYAWSADGSLLAFHGWDDIDHAHDGMYTARSSDGGGLRLVAVGQSPLAFDPHGERILATTVVTVHNGTPDTGDLYVERIDGTGKTRLNSSPLAVFTESEGPGSARPAAWSPDGSRIAFAAFDTTAQSDANSAPTGAIYVIDVDGRHLKRLTPVEGVVSGVQWSPDGNWISFSEGVQLPSQQIEIVHPDGTDLHAAATQPKGSCCAVWSPDSSRLLVLGSGLRVVSIDGSVAVDLGVGPVDGFEYVWVRS